MMKINDVVGIYRDWGFVPLPVRNYLKFPAHLRISGQSYADLVQLSAVTQSWDSATGVWLLLAEPARDDGYVHVAVDFDELPPLGSLSPRAQEMFRDYANNTFAYWTARGAHFHFFVPASEIPIRQRMAQAFSNNDERKHLFDLFVFAPPDDRVFAGSWRRGVLAYPSEAYDTHSSQTPPPIASRKLIGTELKPPLRISWGQLSEFLRAIYGEFTFGRRVRAPNLGRVNTDPSTNTTPSTPQAVEQVVATALRMLWRYPCVSSVLPRVAPDNRVVATPERVIPKGSRNNGLFGILSVYNYLLEGEAPADVLYKLARVVNQFALQPPLSDAEVVRVVMSVAGGGYGMKPATFAKQFGLTMRCATCPLRELCEAGDAILAPKQPELEEISAEGDQWFAKRAFRSSQQLKMYRDLLDALKYPSTTVVLGLAPTGSGKTVHAASLAKFVVDEWHTSVVVLVPTKQLQNQHEATLAAHRAGNVPHVVFKGRSNFKCPFLELARAIAKERGIAAQFKDTPTAQDGPCAYGPACDVALSAAARLQEVESESAKSKLRQILSEFEDAVTLALAKYVDDLGTLSQWSSAVLQRFFSYDEWDCAYREMISKVNKYSSGIVPGVIIANKSLVWVMQRVARAYSDAQKPAVTIVDEAHELLDALVKKYRLRYVEATEDVEPAFAINVEVESISQEIERARERIRELSKGGSVKRLRKLARELTTLRRYLQDAQIYQDMVTAHPDAFVLVTENDAQYIYPLRNHRADILRAYLTKVFPNMKFVLLTATGASLERAADIVIRADSVIPVTNRMIIYEPLRNLSARRIGARLVEVYLHQVVDHIVARYGFFGPELARILGQPKIRAIVHESRKERAVLIAYGLWKRGYNVLLYAGNKRDWDNMTLVQEFADELAKAAERGDVGISYSLEDVVAKFKTHHGYDFLVSVALGTGHDFDEDDIALQFIVKVPYPQWNATEYELIEKRDGHAERVRQYHYDTLMALIQAAGRTTRKPTQKSVTIIMDQGFLGLLRSAWQDGYRDEVLELASRVWCPSTEEDSVRRTLPPEVANVFLTTPDAF